MTDRQDHRWDTLADGLDSRGLGYEESLTALASLKADYEGLQTQLNEYKTNAHSNHLRLAMLGKERDEATAKLERIEGERDRYKQALEAISKLKPLYVRPSMGKDWHKCHDIARAALRHTTEGAETDVEWLESHAQPTREACPNCRHTQSTHDFVKVEPAAPTCSCVDPWHDTQRSAG